MKTPHDERTLRAAAALGIDSGHARRSHAGRIESLSLLARRLNGALAPGGVALIVGPSGAGKSTLLRLLASTRRTEAVRPLAPRQERTPVAALCARTPLTRWAGLLARFGLAEARVLVSRAGDLSAGERARLELALAAARCERGVFETSPERKLRDGGVKALELASDLNAALAHKVVRPCAPAQGSFPPTLIVDEWCSVLDRPTAASVAAGAARWAREQRARLIGATAHEDLAAAIVADVTVRFDGQGGVEWTDCGLSKAG